MKDRPFEVGFREQASNHPKRQKAVVVSVGEKIPVRYGDERERTPDDVSKGSRRNQERSWDKVGRCPMIPASGMKGA